MQECEEANWGRFYRRGQVMPFSKEIGLVVKELIEDVSKIGQIFEAIG